MKAHTLPAYLLLLILVAGCGGDQADDRTKPTDHSDSQDTTASAEGESTEPVEGRSPEPVEGRSPELVEGHSPELVEGRADSNLELLGIELPKPITRGTPKDIEEPNLEDITGKLRPPFLAPEGTKNLAADRPVTSSDELPILGELSQITDGDKEGREGSFVELGPGVQWVQIDLGRPAEIFAVVVWHYHAKNRVYRDVVVQTADDPDFVTNVRTIFNNDHDNSAGLGVGTDKNYIDTFEGKLFDAGGAKGRYVRLYSNGNHENEGNHYIEVEVYGRPIE